MGYNELLLMMIENPTQKTYLKKEKIAVDRIRVQFQLAKDYQNLGVEPPRWQMIRSVVHRAGELFDLKNIRVVETCGDAAICADPLFDNAISYLFDNAIHYGGNVTEIHVFLEDAAHGVVLVFADNGEGIPAAYKEKCFERGVGKNTGWGLFLVREILAVTRITIAETGEPGKGARFEMHIPSGTFRREIEKTPV
jgi:signal transduction histidine kinase